MTSDVGNPHEAIELRTDASPFENQPEEHPRFNLVHKMVLQGESEERVIKRLEVNGVTGNEANLLYHHARKNRIATIRKEFFKKASTGLGLILFSISVFCVFWFGLGFISNNVLYLLCGISVFGIWRLGSGILGYLNAGSHEGSVADEI
ncbi:MAG: hypothetical protein ACON5H_06505 [Akkermansiaceae bacterium]